MSSIRQAFDFLFRRVDLVRQHHSTHHVSSLSTSAFGIAVTRRRVRHSGHTDNVPQRFSVDLHPLNKNDDMQKPRSPAKMRPPRSRPTSQQSAQPYSVQPVRKVFNCIVDDTALVAGVKKSTRNGIRQWVKNGQIRLFVPLHALDQLSRQKNSSNRHGEDVRETLQWLDEATTKYPYAVTLQGGDQYYQKWVEVEKFAVPRTLFSEHDHLDEPNTELDVATHMEDTIDKLISSDQNPKTPPSSAGSNMSGTASPTSMRSAGSSLSPISPPTSPTKGCQSPVTAFTALTEAHVHEGSASATVPVRLQALFNYILWRVHQELDPIAALESFIFLCNDPSKVNYARGFDIRYKRLEQLREAVSREERDSRQRRSLQNRGTDAVLSTEAELPPTPAQDDEESDDNEVVFKPPPRAPAAMLQKQPNNVMDPNAFSRSTAASSSENKAPSQSLSPRQSKAQPQSQRDRGTAPFSHRGNGRHSVRGATRGRGANSPAGSKRGGFSPVTRATEISATSPERQIDPDSFTRPRGSGYAGRGGRKLWVPT
nr:hypothetical protein CFP56_64032 [Quercus suber]